MPEQTVSVSLVPTPMISVELVGRAGPQGLAGGNGSFEYVFEVDDFVDGILPVPHNLGYKPVGVMIEDSGGSIWKPVPQHVNDNLFNLDLAGLTFSGTVYIS